MHILASRPTPPRSDAGYSVVEIIVVMAIMAVLVTASFGLVSLDQGGKFESQVQNTLAAMRQLQSNARTVHSNLEYGISFSGNSWTTFSRDPATGTQTNLQTTQLSRIDLTTALVPPGSDVIFSRLTGTPVGGANGTITFTHTGKPARTVVIKVESTGVVYVQ